MKRLSHIFTEIISVENLLLAWREFLVGKRSKKDVQEFQLHFMDNILFLHEGLVNHTYRHGGYQAFRIQDPKPRDIHKASVRDRLLHHAIYRILYTYFDKRFIADSFSCRDNKGTHKALDRFRAMGRIVGKNHTRTVWVLKLDIRKFFANIDHQILTRMLGVAIDDAETMNLLREIIGSFSAGKPDVGLPLGNLTSQLLVNVYMNEFDQFVKQELKVKYYIRYADDFVFLSREKLYLQCLLPIVEDYLWRRLRLRLHPDKVVLKTLASGIDFLGWVHFTDHRVLRAATKRRMMRAMAGNPSDGTRASYLGILGHGNAYNIARNLQNAEWFDGIPRFR